MLKKIVSLMFASFFIFIDDLIGFVSFLLCFVSFLLVCFVSFLFRFLFYNNPV